MRKIFLVFCSVWLTIGSIAQLTLPLDFESASLPYTFTNFDGGVATVIDNPQKSGINISNKTGRMVKNAGQFWGGSWIELGGPIDFSTNTTFRMKVYSPRAGAKVLLKVEDKNNATVSFEKEALTTVANTWEELTFDFGGINKGDAYHKIVLIFEQGTTGDGSANFTFLFDDISLQGGGGGVLKQMDLPVTFDDATVDYGLIGFGGADASTIVADPANSNNKVGKVVKSNTALSTAGTTITGAGQAGFSNKIPFKSGSTKIEVRVWSPDAGIKVRLKAEDHTDATKSVETETLTTVANGWQNLVFDFNNHVAGTPAINFGYNYNKVSIFFNYGVNGSAAGEKTYYFDDVIPGAAEPPPPSSIPTIPLTFESSTVNYTFYNFDGGFTTVLDNPQKGGINPSDKVAKMVKNAGQFWGGSFIELSGPIDFTTTTTFSMKVYSPRVGAKVLLKVENKANAVETFEKQALTSVANAWEELTFDFASINKGNDYHRIVLIFDLGIQGDGSDNFTFLFDDIRLEATGLPPLVQMSMPVSFDDNGVNYGLIGFGGAEGSSIGVDPTNPNNKVARAIKSNTALSGAGIIVTTPSGIGFRSKMPFSEGNASMNIRVWSPDAGIKVRVKVEDQFDPAKSVQTEATTTVANGWQTLIFNFANEVAGTPAINYDFTYDMASIFFNYGVSGAVAGEKTYFFDDLLFGGTPLPVKLRSFDAEKSNQTVQFSWTTTAEVNNREFGVQRSETGEKWNDIAVVKGQGNSNGIHTYKAEDLMPLPGVSYYRLRQTDNDGASVYSKVKLIDFSGAAMEAMRVYPNPASGRLNVIANTFDGKVGYTIIGTDGRQVGSGMFPNTLSATGINISNLKPGIYILKLQNEKNTKTIKFMVQ